MIDFRIYFNHRKIISECSTLIDKNWQLSCQSPHQIFKAHNHLRFLILLIRFISSIHPKTLHTYSKIFDKAVENNSFSAQSWRFWIAGHLFGLIFALFLVRLFSLSIYFGFLMMIHNHLRPDLSHYLFFVQIIQNCFASFHIYFIFILFIEMQ